jgi:hypothetical protein
MKKLMMCVVAAMALPVWAQTADTAAEAKALGKVEQAQIKAHKKVDKALTEEARANVKADAKADDKKLKAHHKAQKEIGDAAADLKKAETKAQVQVARENK